MSTELRQVASAVPRTRIMQHCRHESNWWLEASSTLPVQTQPPKAWHAATHFASVVASG